MVKASKIGRAEALDSFEPFQVVLKYRLKKTYTCGEGNGYFGNRNRVESVIWLLVAAASSRSLQILTSVRTNANKLIKSESSQPVGHDTYKDGARTVRLFTMLCSLLKSSFAFLNSATGPPDLRAVWDLLSRTSLHVFPAGGVVALNSSSRFARNTPLPTTFLESGVSVPV